MIKDKVRRALKTEEIDRIKAELLELKEKVESLSQKYDSTQKVVEERFDYIDTRLNDREFLSLEYLSLDKKPKILICGFYGARNLGDELMLQSVLSFFNEKNIRVTILLSDNYGFDASVYAPHDVIHYPKCSSDILALSNYFETIIWGGGAHLDDFNYKFNREGTSLSYILNKLSMAVIRKGGDVIVLGVSSNKEITNLDYIGDLQFIIDHSKYFSLRDTNSLSTLKDAGIRVGDVRIIDDLAINLLRERSQTKKDKRKITIGLVYILTEESYRKLGSFTKCLIEQIKKETEKEVRIKMIPFYDYCDNDRKWFAKMIEGYRIDQDIVDIVNYSDTMDDLIDVIEECDVIVSMRYHATLVAANLGINTVSLDYSDMHRHYYNKINYIREKYCRDLINYSFSDDIKTVITEIIRATQCQDKMIDYEGKVKTYKKALKSELIRALSDCT